MIMLRPAGAMLFVFLLLVSPVFASTVTVGLDRVVVDGQPIPPGDAPWLLATFTDVESGEGYFVQVTLSGPGLTGEAFVGGVLSPERDPGVGGWYFNLSGVDRIDLVTDSDGGPSAQAFMGPRAVLGDYDFNVKFVFGTAGTNGQRLERDETVVFNLYSDSGDLTTASLFPGLTSEAPYLSLAHVQGIDLEGGRGEGSTWVAAVPLPASAYLLGSGFIGLAGLRSFLRRRRERTEERHSRPRLRP